MKPCFILVLITASLVTHAQIKFDTSKATKWMHVHDVPFGQVLNALKIYYNYSLKVQVSKKIINDKINFSEELTKNITEILSDFSEFLNVDCYLKDKIIIVRKKSISQKNQPDEYRQ
jgi:Ni,Fe-hydrogenase maturation factor